MIKFAIEFSTKVLDGSVGICKAGVIPCNMERIDGLQAVFLAHRSFVEKSTATVVGHIHIANHQVAPYPGVHGIPGEGPHVGDFVLKDNEVVGKGKIPSQTVQSNLGLQGKQMVGDRLAGSGNIGQRIGEMQFKFLVRQGGQRVVGIAWQA